MIRGNVSVALGLLLACIVTTGGACAEVTKGAVAQDDATLVNIRDAVRRVRSAALEVVNDVEERKLAALPGDSLFLFPSQLKDRDPKVWARESAQLGPIEVPRKQWLDSDIEHLDKWVSVLQANVTTLVTSSPAMAESSDVFTDIMQDVQKDLAKLHTLSAGPKYDNLAIGKAALGIYDDVAKLEKPWKNAVKK